MQHLRIRTVCDVCGGAAFPALLLTNNDLKLTSPIDNPLTHLAPTCRCCSCLWTWRQVWCLHEHAGVLLLDDMLHGPYKQKRMPMSLHPACCTGVEYLHSKGICHGGTNPWIQ